MRLAFRMSAIVAALAILAGCGQRGPLYLPNVPTLPQKPIEQRDPPPSDVKPSDETASSESMPDMPGTPLMLSPELSSNSAASANDNAAAVAPTPASGSARTQ